MRNRIEASTTKIIKKELARVLAELPNLYTGKVYKWDDFPYYRQLGYEAEADRFFEAIKVLRKEDKKQ